MIKENHPKKEYNERIIGAIGKRNNRKGRNTFKNKQYQLYIYSWQERKMVCPC